MREFGDVIAELHEFQSKTFGDRQERTAGVLDHCRKELVEIEQAPGDLEEWVDLMFLALDGYRRNGGGAYDLADRFEFKLELLRLRTWPDWRTTPDSIAIEHDRNED